MGLAFWGLWIFHFWIICCTMIWWVIIKWLLKYFSQYQTDSTFPSDLVIRTVGSLCHRRNLTLVKTSVKQHWYHCSGPQTNSANHRNCIFNFLTSNQNGFINKPIVAHTQILVNKWGPRRILALFHRRT